MSKPMNPQRQYPDPPNPPKGGTGESGVAQTTITPVETVETPTGFYVDDRPLRERAVSAINRHMETQLAERVWQGNELTGYIGGRKIAKLNAEGELARRGAEAQMDTLLRNRKQVDEQDVYLFTPPIVITRDGRKFRYDDTNDVAVILS